jgi:hypothetical protein
MSVTIVVFCDESPFSSVQTFRKNLSYQLYDISSQYNAFLFMELCTVTVFSISVTFLHPDIT